MSEHQAQPPGGSMRPSNFLTTREAAAALGVRPRTIRQRAKARRVASRKFGRDRLWSPEALASCAAGWIS